MKRTTIFIPEALERELQLYANRAGKPVASIVREAVAAYIVDPLEASTLPSFTGAFDSGHTDTAERHDELLFDRLAPHDRSSRTGHTPSVRRAAPAAAARRPARRPKSR